MFICSNVISHVIYICVHKRMTEIIIVCNAIIYSALAEVTHQYNDPIPGYELLDLYIEYPTSWSYAVLLNQKVSYVELYKPPLQDTTSVYRETYVIVKPITSMLSYNYRHAYEYIMVHGSRLTNSHTKASPTEYTDRNDDNYLPSRYEGTGPSRVHMPGEKLDEGMISMFAVRSSIIDKVVVKCPVHINVILGMARGNAHMNNNLMSEPYLLPRTGLTHLKQRGMFSLRVGGASNTHSHKCFFLLIGNGCLNASPYLRNGNDGDDSFCAAKAAIQTPSKTHFMTTTTVDLKLDAMTTPNKLYENVPKKQEI